MPECVCPRVWARYLVTEGFSPPGTRNSPPKRGGEHARRFRAERAAVGGTLWGCTRQCQVVSGARGCSFLPLGTRGPAGACEEPRGCPTRLNSYKLTVVCSNPRPSCGAAMGPTVWGCQGALPGPHGQTLLVLSRECPRVEPMKGALICSLI